MESHFASGFAHGRGLATACGRKSETLCPAAISRPGILGYGKPHQIKSLPQSDIMLTAATWFPRWSRRVKLDVTKLSVRKYLNEQLRKALEKDTTAQANIRLYEIR